MRIAALLRHSGVTHLRLQETEASHTLGGAGQGHVQGRGKAIGCIYSCAIRYT
jgi:hypothetical protein